MENFLLDIGINGSLGKQYNYLQSPRPNPTKAIVRKKEILYHSFKKRKKIIIYKSILKRSFAGKIEEEGSRILFRFLNHLNQKLNHLS
jgi:hypothetical protein